MVATAILGSAAAGAREVGVEEWASSVEAAQQEMHLAAVSFVCGVRDKGWVIALAQSVKSDLRTTTQQVIEPLGSKRTFEQRWSWTMTMLQAAVAQNVYSSQ